jgi:ABC-2 type transport system permease protein
MQSFYKKDKKKTIATFIIALAVLIALNILSQYKHVSLDLTDDSKFTLSKPSKTYLASLKDVVNIKVLLKGKMPSNYQKLLQGTTDVLNSIQQASGGKVKFAFENPIEGKSEEDKMKTAKELTDKGMQPLQLQNEVEEGDGMERRYVFPYAVISANAKENNVCLLENHLDMDMDGILNYSESMLEYKIVSTIKSLHTADKQKIAYLVGHGEPMNYNILDAFYSLGQYYSIDTVDLTKGIEIPAVYKCAIMCRPTSSLEDKDKFKIDQYVMNGGRMLFFIDAININMDTMIKTPTFTAMPYNLNLDNLLFTYGVRINPNLIEDLQCCKIPLTVGVINNAPDIRKESWLYFPMLTPISKHPIVANMDAVCSKFASAIDTINNGLNKKTILLNSSQYSRAMGAPVEVSFNMVRYKPKTSLYNKKYIPIAVSLEGDFKSAYTNITPQLISIYEDSLGKKFKVNTSKPNKMIVVSDADIMLNDYSAKYGPSELGFYKPTGELFANKPFLLNAVEYLTDDNSLLEARNKNVQLRLMDKKKIKNNKVVIQILNVVLPIALVLFIGMAYMYFRQKKYQQALKVK